jgi:hypothetical protein
MWRLRKCCRNGKNGKNRCTGETTSDTEKKNVRKRSTQVSRNPQQRSRSCAESFFKRPFSRDPLSVQFITDQVVNRRMSNGPYNSSPSRVPSTIPPTVELASPAPPVRSLPTSDVSRAHQRPHTYALHYIPVPMRCSVSPQTHRILSQNGS